MEREGWGVSAGVRVKRRERRRSVVEESDGGMMERRGARSGLFTEVVDEKCTRGN